MKVLSGNQNAWSCVLGLVCLFGLGAAACFGTPAQAGGSSHAFGDALQARALGAAFASPDASYRITTQYAPLQDIYLGYAHDRRIVVGLTVDAEGYQDALDALSLHGHVPALAVNPGENLQANRVVREGGRILLRFRGNSAYVSESPAACSAQDER